MAAVIQSTKGKINPLKAWLLIISSVLSLFLLDAVLRYRQTDGSFIHAFDAGGTDLVATEQALAAITAADSTDPAAIAAALPAVTYEGVTGAIAFDENGDAKKDMAYIKYANPETGAFDFVKTQSVGE